ncbi:MAG TPA: VOC family protein [Ktedonobacteraceae bacterium]|nr:VOC family protein [Ktedonobacteraceae bacterium]
MANIVPYITFAKNGQEAITFYKRVFGGDAEVQVEGERVIHLDFQADGIHFMGSDLQSDQAGLERDNTYSLVLNCDSEEQLRDFYAGLVDGGTEVFAPTDSGWGAIIAHCTDQFGVAWLMNYDQPQS